MTWAKLYVRFVIASKENIMHDHFFKRQTLHIDNDKKRIALVETKTIDSPPPTMASAIRFHGSNKPFCCSAI